MSLIFVKLIIMCLSMFFFGFIVYGALGASWTWVAVSIPIAVYSESCVQLFAMPWTAACQAPLSFIISQSLLKLCPLSWWHHPAISSSLTTSSCPQSFPASGFFPVSRLFASHGQSTGASTSASVLPMNIQGWFPLGLTGLISLSPRDSQESSPAPQFERINSLVLSLLYGPTLKSEHYY